MRLLEGAQLIGVVVVGACAGCDTSRKLVVHDTEGREFWAVCRPDEPCQVGRSDDDVATMVLFRPGRVVSVCPLASTTEAWQCRPLNCAQDAECPPVIGLVQGACVSGLCIEPSQGIVTDDAIVLCLAGTGLGNDSQLQVARFAMALQCGSPCVVPKPCRQL